MKTIITRRIALVAAVCAALFMFRCADLSGGGSEAGNARITGRVLDTHGVPVSKVMVTVLPSDFDPLKKTASSGAGFDTTGPDGTFGLSVQKYRTYTIQTVQISIRTRALIAGLVVGDSDITAPQCTLKVPGVVRVMLPDGADPLGYVYVPGTSVLAALKKGDSFVVLDSVPAGVLPTVSYSSNSSSFSAVIRYDVPVVPGDTVIVFNPSWKYVRHLRLNTTTSGANVTGDVMNFPVLIRLNKGNFVFAQAKADGGDIRFSKNDGTPLPFEIARWDRDAQAAEVWVKLDTVYGNDSLQHIAMYWGNPAALPESAGAKVFDSVSGFEAVWHLNETSGTLAHDASRNGFMGTYRGGLPKGLPGPLGISQNIVRPDTDYIEMGNVLNPGMKNFAIGVWLKRAAMNTQQAIIAKTNGNAPSAAYGFLFNFDSDNLPHLYMATGSGIWGGDTTFDVKTDLAITDSTTWHYVVVVIDRSNNALCKMYLDGIDRTGHIGGNIARISTVSNALDFHIGTESDNNCSFTGTIGEVTAAFTARSGDWVKLCYMNQKGQDALVKW